MRYFLKQEISLVTAVMSFSRMVLKREKLMMVCNVPKFCCLFYVHVLLGMTV